MSIQNALSNDAEPGGLLSPAEIRALTDEALRDADRTLAELARSKS